MCGKCTLELSNWLISQRSGLWQDRVKVSVASRVTRQGPWAHFFPPVCSLAESVMCNNIWPLEIPASQHLSVSKPTISRALATLQKEERKMSHIQKAVFSGELWGCNSEWGTIHRFMPGWLHSNPMASGLSHSSVLLESFNILYSQISLSYNDLKLFLPQFINFMYLLIIGVCYGNSSISFIMGLCNH